MIYFNHIRDKIKKMAELQYIFHCGVRLNMNGMSILMDPYSKIEHPIWGNTPDDVYNNLILKPPTDILLITHAHDDHFNLEATLEIIKRNPGIKVVSTMQITEMIREHGEGIKRENLLPSKKAESVEHVKVGDIDIALYASTHFGTPGHDIEHAVFLVKRERKVLNMGDAIPNFDLYADMAKEEGIDMFLAPFTYITRRKFRDAVRNELNPKVMACFHLPKPVGDGVIYRRAVEKCALEARKSGMNLELLDIPGQRLII